MNRDPIHPAWRRIVDASRSAPAAPEAISAPAGFSTRVVALAFESSRQGLAAALERLSWRALGISLALCLLCMASAYPVLVANGNSQADDGDITDPVAEVMALDL